MKRTLLTALALAFLVPGVAKAQSSAAGSVTLNVNQILSIQITANSDVTFSPTEAEFDAGLIDGESATLRTKGNTPHEILVSADVATFGYTGSAAPPPAKPSTDFQWKVGAGTYVGMTLAPAQVGTFARGVHDTNVDYQLLLNYVNDPEGTYDLAYTYEILPN
jgi:hypothetical protein